MAVTNLAAGVQTMTSNAFLVTGTSPTIIDAGAGFDIVSRVDTQTDTDPDYLILTHTHPDHVGNVDDLRDAYDLEVLGDQTGSIDLDRTLADGDTVEIGTDEYVAWFTPGHAPDHLCLYSEARHALFSGDLIFPNGGVGRTDLPGCDHDALVESIHRVHTEVDPSLERLYAGHGPIIDHDAYRHIEAAARFVGDG